MERPISENEGDRPSSPASALPMGSIRVKDRGEDEVEVETETNKVHFAEDDDEQDDRQKPASTVRSLVASTLEKERRQNAKHHSKRGTTKVGRAKGHKGKMNNRVKADSSGVWD